MSQIPFFVPDKFSSFKNTLHDLFIEDLDSYFKGNVFNYFKQVDDCPEEDKENLLNKLKLDLQLYFSCKKNEYQEEFSKFLNDLFPFLLSQGYKFLDEKIKEIIEYKKESIKCQNKSGGNVSYVAGTNLQLENLTNA